MGEPVIVDAVRTPIGKREGLLRAVRPEVLYAKVLDALVARNGLAPELVDDVITGCVTQAGEQGMNVGRLAALCSSLGHRVPAVTLSRLCGSSQQAVHFAAQAIAAGDAQPPAGRPDLRAPRLALPAPGGEVLYGHRQLVAMALAWGAFFQLGPEATTALLVPPADWLGLAALLGALCRGAAVLLRWSGRGGGVTVDYLVLRWRDAGDADVAAWRGRVRLGALVGIEGPFQAWPRRRLARTLETPALTVLGRNDLGPYVASHPEWSLADAAGIVLCNADLHPLDPSDGHPLPVGWDLVEAAEIGVKSPAVPQGAQVVEDGWARTHLLAHIDPSGLYYLRRSLQL